MHRILNKTAPPNLRRSWKNSCRSTRADAVTASSASAASVAGRVERESVARRETRFAEGRQKGVAGRRQVERAADVREDLKRFQYRFDDGLVQAEGREKRRAIVFIAPIFYLSTYHASRSKDSAARRPHHDELIISCKTSRLSDNPKSYTFSL